MAPAWWPDQEHVRCKTGDTARRRTRPEDIYREVHGVAPDLIVYFGDLAWRSVGAVGMGGIHTFENDTGPDEANHDWYGIFVLSTAGARGAAPRRISGRLDLRRRADAAPAPRSAGARRARRRGRSC